ncbi:hypothetical protein HanRHA438_Chr14g0675611 [Helianthus annuus]|uniref:Uncharacterized protein n=1 Tax=Helianthus annuus TaxID=4232 RepID=A0A9K3ECA2_HELAN|nr:hypothetical protein HanXRQr2_Chr14g0664371 [Helianthus annuus]KAJ0855648.1 hypothetical protein HanRHA438_Chr14g0675611 [Helianthus annuus]
MTRLFLNNKKKKKIKILTLIFFLPSLSLKPTTATTFNPPTTTTTSTVTFNPPPPPLSPSIDPTPTLQLTTTPSKNPQHACTPFWFCSQQQKQVLHHPLFPFLSRSVSAPICYSLVLIGVHRTISSYRRFSNSIFQQVTLA